MIGKVIRGTDARRLLYYLYGPGKANEHTDPHLVAGFADPAELEPAHRPGRSRDFRPLAGLLAQPMAARQRVQLPPARVALRGPGRAGGPGAVGRGVGAGRRRTSWTGPGWPRKAMTWRCGGWRSGTPRITSTWSPRWPGRTGSGRRCGTTTSGCGTPAGTPNGGSGCGHRAGGSHRGPAADPRRGGADGPARMGRTTAGQAAAGGMHRGGRSADGAGVLRPAGPGRGAGAPPLQQHPSRRGDRVCGRPGPAHQQGRAGHLVRRREARGRPDAAQAARPVG